MLCLFYASYAQIGYNITHTFDPKNSAHSSARENGDTLVVFGPKVTINGNGFNQRYLKFCNPINGAVYRDVILDDTSGRIGGVIGESMIHKNAIYLLNCRTKSSDTVTAELQKLDIHGNLLWNHRYNKDYYYSTIRDIEVINDSVFLLCGEVESTHGNLDVRLLWLDTNGNVLNEKIYPKPLIQYGWLIDQFNNGDILLDGAGWINSTSGVRTFSRLSPEGEIVWTKNVGGNGGNYGTSILAKEDSSIYYFGNFAYPNQVRRPRIIKLNSEGDTLWSHVNPDPGTIIEERNGYEIGEIGVNHTVVALMRYQDSINYQNRYLLEALSTEGLRKWQRKVTIRETSNYVTGIQKMTNGDFLITGYAFGDPQAGTIEDGWLVRVNCIGLFEHPIDSVSVSANFQSVQVSNIANHFAFSEVNWGDGTEVDVVESTYSDSTEYLLFNHQYQQAGLYEITAKTIACNDTLTSVFRVELISSNFDNPFLNVFPNPNSGIFSLSLKHEGTAALTVYDNSGKIVFVDEMLDLNKPQKIELDFLLRGVYYLLVRTIAGYYNVKVVVY